MMGECLPSVVKGGPPLDQRLVFAGMIIDNEVMKYVLLFNNFQNNQKKYTISPWIGFNILYFFTILC